MFWLNTCIWPELAGHLQYATPGRIIAVQCSYCFSLSTKVKTSLLHLNWLKGSPRLFHGATVSRYNYVVQYTDLWPRIFWCLTSLLSFTIMSLKKSFILKWYLNQISLYLFPKGPIGNFLCVNSGDGLVRMKPLPEPILIQFICGHIIVFQNLCKLCQYDSVNMNQSMWINQLYD